MSFISDMPVTFLFLPSNATAIMPNADVCAAAVVTFNYAVIQQMKRERNSFNIIKYTLAHALTVSLEKG